MNSEYKTGNRFNKGDLRSGLPFSRDGITLDVSRISNESQKQASQDRPSQDRPSQDKDLQLYGNNIATIANTSDISVLRDKQELDFWGVGENTGNPCSTSEQYPLNPGCEGERWTSETTKHKIHELRKYVSTMTNAKAKEQLRNFLEVYAMVKIYLTESEREKGGGKRACKVTEVKNDRRSEESQHGGDDASNSVTPILTAADNAGESQDNHCTSIADSLAACFIMRPPNKLRNKFVLTKDPSLERFARDRAQCKDAFEPRSQFADMGTVGESELANEAWLKITQLKECLEELKTEERHLLAGQRAKKVYLSRRKKELRKHEGNKLSKQLANRFKHLKQLYYSETMALIEKTNEKLDELTSAIRGEREEDLKAIQVRLPAVSTITKAAVQLQSTLNRALIGQLARSPELGGRDDQRVLATLTDVKSYVQSMVTSLCSMTSFVTSLPCDATQGQLMDKTLENLFVEKKASMDDVCCRTYAFYEMKKLTTSVQNLALASKDKLATLNAVSMLDTTLSSFRNNMTIHRLKCHCLLGNFSTSPDYLHPTVNSLPPTKMAPSADVSNVKLGASVSYNCNDTPSRSGAQGKTRSVVASQKSGVYCSYSDTSNNVQGSNRNTMGSPGRSREDHVRRSCEDHVRRSCEDHVRRSCEEHQRTIPARHPMIGKERVNTPTYHSEICCKKSGIPKWGNQTSADQPLLARLGENMSDSDSVDERPRLPLPETNPLNLESPKSATTDATSSPISCYTSSEGDLRDKLMGFTNWVHAGEHE